MFELQIVRADHQAAILAFELDNRDYFAGSISDRGDAYFERFPELYQEMLADQEAGTSVGYVLVDATDGSVVGRFNLYRLHDGVAEIGYRMARRAAGRGMATETVRELCRLARSRHGLHTLTAAASDQNVASQRVLIKAGFTNAGPADPADIGGKQGHRYQRDLNSD